MNIKADFDNIIGFPYNWKMVKCKRSGWFHNPRELRKDYSHYAQLFSIPESEFKSHSSMTIIEEKLAEFCVVEGLEISLWDRMRFPLFMEALAKLPHLSLIKGQIPERSIGFVDQLEKLESFETLITSILNFRSPEQDYSKLTSLKNLAINFIMIIEDPACLPQELEILVVYRNLYNDSDTKFLNSLSSLKKIKRIHMINSQSAIKYGALSSNSPFIAGSAYEEEWEKLSEQFPGVHLDFSVDPRYFGKSLSDEKRDLLEFISTIDEDFMNKEELDPEKVLCKLLGFSMDLATSLPDSNRKS